MWAGNDASLPHPVKRSFAFPPIAGGRRRGPNAQAQKLSTALAGAVAEPSVELCVFGEEGEDGAVE